ADYFRRVREIAATGLVDCLAHIDLVKIHGHRPNAEIEVIAGETLDFIRSRNLAIELSTAGWRKPVNELYPADRIIELAIEKGIPLQAPLTRIRTFNLAIIFRVSHRGCRPSGFAKYASSRSTTAICASYAKHRLHKWQPIRRFYLKCPL